MWLTHLGSEVYGFALHPPTDPSLYELAVVTELVNSKIGDIRNFNELRTALNEAAPDIVIHMAAQPLVRRSYEYTLETYSINVMGTVHLLEAVKKVGSIRAVINVTTDKCYENKDGMAMYGEDSSFGGYDPYSNSKACSELVTSAFRNSYFNPNEYSSHGVALASVRAGNVIGGGDWALDRLMPDCIRCLLRNEKIVIRYPEAIRPWQHVIEPLYGYLMLAQKLYIDGCKFSSGWNFGPDRKDTRTVKWIVERVCRIWGGCASYEFCEGKNPAESKYMMLDCTKAKHELGWYPKWNADKAIEKVVSWTHAYKDKKDLRKICIDQIAEYSERV